MTYLACSEPSLVDSLPSAPGANVVTPASPALQKHLKPAHRDGWFTTTQWNVVQRAQRNDPTDSASALEEICRTYWSPLYAYVRREGYAPEDARDLTQGFFARFLEKDYLAQVDRDKGRFRSFLIASLRHFLSDERDRCRALKRGGAYSFISLDAVAAEGLYREEPVDETSSERLFERRWALGLLETARSRLAAEYANAGKSRRYTVLQQFLPGNQEGDSYAKLAAELGCSIGTIKWEVHHLKRRYAELLRAEIARTVPAEHQIEEEVRYLISILSA